MHAEKKLLWQPDAETKARTQLAKFADFVKTQTNFDWHNEYEKLWQWSVDDTAQFWNLFWDWSGVIGDKGNELIKQSDVMYKTRFFPEAKLNFAQNLLTNADEQTAIISVTEKGELARLTRKQVEQQARKLAAWMQANGVGKGDRVAAYLPNTHHTVIAMLASACIGAIFTSCSPDFGLTGVSDRFCQIKAKILIATDGYFYAGKTIDRKQVVIDLISQLPELEQVVIVSLLEDENQLELFDDLDVPVTLFEDTLQIEQLADYEQLDFDHPLYILYSSGTTGAPKCIVHGAGGTLLQHIKEHRLQSNVCANDTICYFATCGWMMWHWLCSALASQATIVLFDGNPVAPIDRLWQLVEEEGISLLGVSAKYIDTIRKANLNPDQDFDLSKLRTMCSTGSPLSTDGFEYIYSNIKQDLHLASISGGTDIISCFVLGVPIKPVYAGHIQGAGLGMDMAVLDDEGNKVLNEMGELCCLSAFPCMPVGFWNDPDDQRYHASYFDKFPNIWCHGDFATHTETGEFIIHGRSDATLKPSGVRIGTAEIYRITESFEEVVESLVIGQQLPEDVRVVLFVRLADSCLLDDQLKSRIATAIKQQVSPRHVPSVMIAVEDIPRTLSGKISEIAVRDVVHNRPVKNTASLANPQALELYKNLPQLEL